MKLEKIKLAGFKSFVDPTTIPITGNLTAIVGPNGCGKSNIIDAVRWVMGESSAKHLRGGNMTDVIFNGSSTRKPVNTATVELVFNNSERKLGGAYAQYDSLSIKRQVSRDGHSLFMLNGSRCRRKDITDLFLGTGLGARSYAIIEQGTISRMVEAKPEELRVHIEEAAGISKYKERRQETELRMRHTRENLERLSDLRDEVEKQCKHLQKQAEKAQQYTVLKKQQRQAQLALLALRWQGYEQTAKHQESLLNDVTCNHNRLFALRQAQEQQQEHQRTVYKARQAQTHVSQGHFYTLTAEVSRLEQAITHHQQIHQQATQELQRANARAAALQHELDCDLQLLEEARQQQSNTEHAHLLAEQNYQHCLAEQCAVAQDQLAWQQQWDRCQEQIAEQKQNAEVLQTKIEQLTKMNLLVQMRLDKLVAERTGLHREDLPQQLTNLEAFVMQLNAQREQHQAQRDLVQQQLSGLRQEQKHHQHHLQTHHRELAVLNGKITSLELLQQHALGKDKQRLTAWLSAANLVDAPRLAESLEVETGWELAVECVLTTYLDAVCVNRLDALLPSLEHLRGDSLVLIALDALPHEINPAQQNCGTQKLSEKVKAPWPLAALLTSIHCTDNLTDAHRLLQRLSPYESAITPDGSWVGSGWLKIYRQHDGKTGLLQRAKALRTLKLKHHELAGLCSTQETTLQHIEKQLKETETDAESQQRQHSQVAAELSTQNAKLSGLQAHAQQQQRRLAHIELECAEIYDQQTDNAEAIAEHRLAFEEVRQKLCQHEILRQELAEQNQHLQDEFRQKEHAANAAQHQFFALKSQAEHWRASEQATQKQIARLQQQQQQTAKQTEELQHQKALALQPIEDDRRALAAQLLAKATQEAQLKQQRQLQDEAEATLSTLAEQQQKTHRELEKTKAELDLLRFERQESQVRRQAVQEQLHELNADAAQILPTLPPDADEAHWKATQDALNKDLERLGTINLTAIEEYQAHALRMQFLDEQQADLLAALQSLDQAIVKIDQESRLRFKETFDKINLGLQEKFPKLFGGGQAYLELSALDRLDAGVNIIARPPGKRNSSIYLLSGGEKALTAVALVFAIFELNPAPFCLLDEVDAPLDDANVGRFSKLVEEMSHSVQFLYVSHNKVTMEIARQLAGVTMKEPGVSRMVAVDIEEAVTLADN